MDGDTVMSGLYTVDPVTGDISLTNPVNTTGTGFTVSLDTMSGNIDPVLGFGLGVTNTSGTIKTFAFAFSLPLGGLSAPLSTSASLDTTLTAFTAEGGTVFATSSTGKIVDSQDIVVSPFASIDKGVDIGAGLSTTAQGTVMSSESATGSILSGGPFDIMSVTVAFGLTDQTGVDLSGFVQQTSVPLPGNVLLFGSGLLGLAGIARLKAA